MQEQLYKRVDVVPAGDATVGLLFMTPPKFSDLPASRTDRLLAESHLEQGVQEVVFTAIRPSQPTRTIPRPISTHGGLDTRIKRAWHSCTVSCWRFRNQPSDIQVHEGGTSFRRGSEHRTAKVLASYGAPVLYVQETVHGHHNVADRYFAHFYFVWWWLLRSRSLVVTARLRGL